MHLLVQGAQLRPELKKDQLLCFVVGCEDIVEDLQFISSMLKRLSFLRFWTVGEKWRSLHFMLVET